MPRKINFLICWLVSLNLYGQTINPSSLKSIDIDQLNTIQKNYSTIENFNFINYFSFYKIEPNDTKLKEKYTLFSFRIDRNLNLKNTFDLNYQLEKIIFEY
jgi:hypothetical protein